MAAPSKQTDRAGRSRLPIVLIALALLGGALLIGLLANPGFRQAAPAASLPQVTAPAMEGSALPSVHGDDAAAAAAPRIAAAEAKTRAEAGTAVFVDVRSGAEYEAGHIAGALSITSTEMETQLKNLPADGLIITYCGQPAEAASARAVQIFKEAGFANVVALTGGIKGWQDQGYPMATGR